MGVLRRSIFVAFLVLTPFFCTQNLNAQNLSVAPLAPRNTSLDQSVISKMQSGFEVRLSVIDPALALSALHAFESVDPFNLSIAEARNLGEAVGGDMLMIVDTSVQPRTTLSSPTTYEAFASVHVIGARSGILLGWKLFSVIGDNQADAIQKLIDSMPSASAWIGSVAVQMNLLEASFNESKKKRVLEDFSDSAVKAPAPYRRLSPNYTDQARLYGREGTVEIQIDLDADGEIKDTRILRWIGFGLEESVTEAIQKMNWRPAYRGGSPIPSRFVVRYNFKRQ